MRPYRGARLFLTVTPGSAFAPPGANNNTPYRGIEQQFLIICMLKVPYSPVGGTVNSPGWSECETRGHGQNKTGAPVG